MYLFIRRSGVPNTCFRIFKCLAGVVRCPVKCFKHLLSNIQVSCQVFRTLVFEYSGVWQVSSGVLSGVSSTCFRICRCPVRCSEHLISNIQVSGRCRQVSCQVFRAPVFEYAGVPSGVLSSVSSTCSRVCRCPVRCLVRCFEHPFSNIQVSGRCRQASCQVFRAPVFEYSGVPNACFRIFRCLAGAESGVYNTINGLGT